MVQKSSKPSGTAFAGHPEPEAEARRPRGRPRAYDTEDALDQARDTFWLRGYSATSLDDLSAATGMNRPSLYGAFGDKRALYLSTLARYIDMNRAAMDHALAGELPLPQALQRIYDLALSLYFPPDGESKGCFLIGTAAVEAVTDDDVRAQLADGLRSFDRSFETRLKRAQQEGELDRHADPAMLAKIASAILHTLAVRSRAGDKRATLRATAAAAVAMICGTTQANDHDSAATARSKHSRRYK